MKTKWWKIINYLSWNDCTPCHSLQHIINESEVKPHTYLERERRIMREKHWNRDELPWQRKTKAFGEHKGNHLQVKSCTPLEFLMYSWSYMYKYSTIDLRYYSISLKERLIQECVKLRESKEEFLTSWYSSSKSMKEKRTPCT